MERSRRCRRRGRAGRVSLAGRRRRPRCCGLRSTGSRRRWSSRLSSWRCCGENRAGDERSGSRPCRRDRQGGVAVCDRRCGRCWLSPPETGVLHHQNGHQGRRAASAGKGGGRTSRRAALLGIVSGDWRLVDSLVSYGSSSRFPAISASVESRRALVAKRWPSVAAASLQGIAAVHRHA